MHLTTTELEAGLDAIRQAPRDHGPLYMIVCRPQIGERHVLQQGCLDERIGLVGDSWHLRKSSRSVEGSPHPDMQVTIMNARAIALVAQIRDRWPLAGDQLFIDMDLSTVNLPPGTQLALGSAVLEVTDEPHTGCQKFLQRFGTDAMRFVNSPVGRQLNLRGINGRVVRTGIIRVGDVASKCSKPLA